MSKVLCKLPNASGKINGVTFVTHKLGMISEEIDDEVALAFAAILGYEVWDPNNTDPVAAALLEKARKEAPPPVSGQAGGATGAAPKSTPPTNSTPPATLPGGKPAGAQEPTF